MSEKRNIPVHCEDCQATSMNLWADGWLNLDCQSLQHPSNPSGNAFLCTDCWQARSQSTGIAMPNRRPQRWPPAAATGSVTMADEGDAEELEIDDPIIPRRLRTGAAVEYDPPAHSHDSGLMLRVRAVLEAIGIDFPQQIQPPDLRGQPQQSITPDMRAYLAHEAYKEARVTIEDALLVTLRSTTALPRAEQELAESCGCTVKDAQRALMNLYRAGMAYPVGTNGWCYGARPGGGRFSR